MKRLVIVLLIIAALGIFFPSFSILAQPVKAPHENPNIATDSLDTVSLMLFYGNIFDLANARQYQDAQGLLNELGEANIPDELRYIIDRYNTLSQQLFTSLINLDSLLDEASSLVARNQIDDAQKRLDSAELAVRDTQSLLKDIEAATNTLGDKLGVSTAAGPVKQAYQRLIESTQRLRKLIDEFDQLRQRLTEKYRTMAMELIPTELSFTITPSPIFVGDSAIARGRLNAGGNLLPQRELAILFNQKLLLVTTTDRDGSYETNIAIPCRYVPNTTLTADYVPTGSDAGTYQGCKSRPVAVNFYRTLLEVSAPEIAPPGMPITIDGQVDSTNGNIDRTIRIFLDNILLTQETVLGKFNLEVTIPKQTITGAHHLTVEVTPQGRYSGTSKNLSIDVSQLPIQTDIQMPQLVITPKQVQISGRVYHHLDPVQGAIISFSFKDSSSVTRTSADGTFTSSVDTPLKLSLFGPQEITMAIEPVEPWYTMIEVKKQILVINPVDIALMLVAFLSLGLLAHKKRRAGLPEENKISWRQLRGLSAVIPSKKGRQELTDTKSRVLSAYTSGLEAVAKITRITVAPHTTLREFLEAVTPLLSTATNPFAELTAISEVVLYSAYRLDDEIANRAEELVITVKKELRSDTS